MFGDAHRIPELCNAPIDLILQKITQLFEIAYHGISIHFLYALIDGHDYKSHQARGIPTHHATWIRPHIFEGLLSDCQVVLTLDADVIVSHLEVPAE